MERTSVDNLMSDLTPEARKLVLAFIEMLHQQPVFKKTAAKKVTGKINYGKFQGMWADRPEMSDSVTYIRELRRQQFSPDRHQ